MALLQVDSRASGWRHGHPFQSDAHAAACRHLAKADAVLGALIVRVGRCRLAPRRNYFAVLCDSIISQQLSTTVAASIFDRFTGLYPLRRPTPRTVVTTSHTLLRAAGLSGQKARYLKDLATGFLDGRIQPSRFGLRSNDEIVEALVSIHGIGRWTAEMFLIFSLNRLDVLPVDDLGIKKAVQRWYGLRALPTPSRLHAISKRWHPYQSIASWYLWQSLRLPR